ncbi:hypothetical protein BV22DRAFT_1047292 [Leucogyrophana mollusca]|uniref:Uncharacterized protein n=1 Tax=Leucogyrophana mollusca TaxID=85980 RepID=A0ACB8BHI5_9AGAM|nr:hypothetical protein BV22DRAFT_1047292 [Leucogyrophana mollusca]
MSLDSVTNAIRSQIFQHPILLHFMNTVVRINPSLPEGQFSLGIDSFYDFNTKMWVAPRKLSNKMVMFLLTSFFFPIEEWISGIYKTKRSTQSGNFRDKTFRTKYRKNLGIIEYMDGLPDDLEENIALESLKLFAPILDAVTESEPYQ